MEALQVAASLDLAHHPTWLKLLHYEGRLPQSVVLTNGFFLSPEGRSNPQAELHATLEAYFLPWQQDTDPITPAADFQLGTTGFPVNFRCLATF